MKRLLKRKILWLPIFFIVCVVLLFSLGFDDLFFSNEEIKIGLIAELSGSMKNVGISSKNAAELAVNEANAAGGILINGKRYPINLIVVDNQSNVSKTDEAVHQLVARRVAAIIGPNASAFAIPAATIAEENKMILMSPWSTDTKTTLTSDNKPKKYVFRAAYTEPSQAAALAFFASNTLQADKIAILYDGRADVQKQQAVSFASFFTKQHGVIVDSLSFTNPNDVKEQLSKIQADKVDYILLPAYAKDAAEIIHQAKAMGIKTPFLGNDAWVGIAPICKNECDNYYMSAHFASNDSAKNVIDFVNTYEKIYKSSPDDVAALSYDATQLLLQAISIAGNNTNDIISSLHTISNFQGVTGTISFNNKTNDPQKDIVILQIKNNSSNVYKIITPSEYLSN